MAPLALAHFGSTLTIGNRIVTGESDLVFQTEML